MPTSKNHTLERENAVATVNFLADLPLYDEEKPYTLYGFPDELCIHFPR